MNKEEVTRVIEKRLSMSEPLKNKKEVLKQIQKSFDDDLKNKLNPLYDIEQGVHENTISDLKELFDAVGNFAFDEAEKQTKRKILQRVEWIKKEIQIMIDEFEPEFPKGQGIEEQVKKLIIVQAMITLKLVEKKIDLAFEKVMK